VPAPSPSTEFPVLTFCVSSEPVLKTETTAFLYFWFANGGVSACENIDPTNELGNAKPVPHEEGGTANFPFPTVRMGDLNPAYPNFFDCEFMIGFEYADTDAAYNAFPLESQVGSIVCNPMPSTATIVQELYGFCFKLFDATLNKNTDATIETLFFCNMEALELIFRIVAL